MSDVSAIARKWIGTPYKHQHATFQRGCDCLGLVRGVYKDIFGQEPEIPPPYSPTWRETGKKEFMLDAARKHLVETDEIKPGVVLMFRMAPNVIVKHCGIMVTHDRMVHAYARSRKVIEHPLVAYWKNKIAGRFEFPLVNHVGD